MLVVIESPFGTNPDGSRADSDTLIANEAYLNDCLRDSFARGEAPFASHGLYPRVFNDATPEERARGMEAGFEWGTKAALRAVYVDRGITPGMKDGIAQAAAIDQRVVYRSLTAPGRDADSPPDETDPRRLRPWEKP